MARTFWQRNESVSCCTEGENGILFNADTGREKVINATGLILWQAMDGTADIERLAAGLAEACEVKVSDGIRADTAEFADELRSEGFAETLDTSLPEPLSAESYTCIGEAPRDFDLSLTGKCNLHCDYCFYADEMVGRNDLPMERWLAFLQELKSLAVRNATLSGGEVFTRPDLWELIDALIEARMRYSILSNGTLITEKTLDEFARGKRRQRLSSIQVSIDGSCAAVHDASRGAGSFEKAVRGLRLLKEAGFPVTVRMTVNQHNVNDIENTARLLLEDVGLGSFSCNEAIALGAGCTRREEMTLTVTDKIKAMLALEQLEKRYPGRIQATAGPKVNLIRFRDMERAKATGWRPNHWRMGSLTACGCAFNKLAVHHDGTIAPCNMLQIELGKIGCDPITQIWKTHPVLKELKERRKVSMLEVPECRDCEWAEVCNGSCPATAYSRTGNLVSANLDDCYREFLKEITPETRDRIFAWKEPGE